MLPLATRVLAPISTASLVLLLSLLLPLGALADSMTFAFSGTVSVEREVMGPMM